MNLCLPVGGKGRLFTLVMVPIKRFTDLCNIFERLWLSKQKSLASWGRFFLFLPIFPEKLVEK